jgi:hypothetical protein
VNFSSTHRQTVECESNKEEEEVLIAAKILLSRPAATAKIFLSEPGEI